PMLERRHLAGARHLPARCWRSTRYSSGFTLESAFYATSADRSFAANRAGRSVETVDQRWHSRYGWRHHLSRPVTPHIPMAISRVALVGRPDNSAAAHSAWWRHRLVAMAHAGPGKACLTCLTGPTPFPAAPPAQRGQHPESTIRPAPKRPPFWRSAVVGADIRLVLALNPSSALAQRVPSGRRHLTGLSSDDGAHRRARGYL